MLGCVRVDSIFKPRSQLMSHSSFNIYIRATTFSDLKVHIQLQQTRFVTRTMPDSTKNQTFTITTIGLIIIIIIIILKTMFVMLSSRQSHCESSPGSFDECRTAPSGCRPKTKPDDLRCESACTGCQNLHHHRHLLLLLSPKADTHFTVLQRVEG